MLMLFFVFFWIGLQVFFFFFGSQDSCPFLSSKRAFGTPDEPDADADADAYADADADAVAVADADAGGGAQPSAGPGDRGGAMISADTSMGVALTGELT